MVSYLLNIWLPSPILNTSYATVSIIWYCHIADDEIVNLKSTSSLKQLIKAIKREYRVSSYGVFSLQYSDGVEFYEDSEEINHNGGETETTLEEFFGNAEGAEIIYVVKKSGKDDLFIGNATNENLIAEVRYGTINRQIQM